MRRLIFAFLLVITPALIVMNGCGSKPAAQQASEKVAEKAIEASLNKDGKTGSVKIDGDKMTMNVKENGKDTSVSFGAGSKMPADFPKDIPVPAGFTPTVSMGQATDQTFTVSGDAKGTVDDVSTAYGKSAAAQGWKETTNFRQAGQMQSLGFEKEGRVLTFVAQKKDQGVAITLAAAKK